jgi:DNA-binding MarR family transcriptional regulator
MNNMAAVRAEVSDEDVARALDATASLLRAHRERILQAAAPKAELPTPETLTSESITNAARQLYRARRRRSAFFGDLGCTFGEPVWDIMLDLFIAEREGRTVSVSSALIGADVPSTTALRYLNSLEQEGIVLRHADPLDRRRCYVRLSRETLTGLECYIREIVTSFISMPR